MYCAYCGKKNKLKAKFCGYCGKQITKNFNIKENIKKHWLVYLIIALLVMISGVLYSYFNYLTKIETVAKQYFEAVINHDSDSLYHYVDSTPFTSKEIFEKFLSNENKHKIINYKVTDILIDNMKGRVNINYLLDGETSDYDVSIYLVKNKNKKYWFFDNWTVVSDIFEIVKNYEIKVPKDATLELENIVVDRSYINKYKSNEYIDTYVIPEMFNYKYHATIRLANGFIIEDDIFAQPLASYLLDDISLTDTMNEKLKSTIKNDLKTVYNSVMNNESSDVFIDHFKTDDNLSSLQKSYDDLYKYIANLGNTLTSIDFTNINLKSVTVQKQGYLKVEVYIKYNYSIKYMSHNGDSSKSNTSDAYITLVYNYKDDAFKLIGMDRLPNYFSRY